MLTNNMLCLPVVTQFVALFRLRIFFQCCTWFVLCRNGSYLSWPASICPAVQLCKRVDKHCEHCPEGTVSHSCFFCFLCPGPYLQCNTAHKAGHFSDKGRVSAAGVFSLCLIQPHKLQKQETDSFGCDRS
jgi:hypothetical protein